MEFKNKFFTHRSNNYFIHWYLRTNRAYVTHSKFLIIFRFNSTKPQKYVVHKCNVTITLFKNFLLWMTISCDKLSLTLHRTFRLNTHKSALVQTVSAKLILGEIKGGRGLTSRFVFLEYPRNLIDFFWVPSGAILRAEIALDFAECVGGSGNVANLTAIRFARSRSSLVGRK